jgi:hypothetical protein
MKKQKKVFQALSMIMQFSFNMLVPILGLTLLGVWIGRKTGVTWIVIPLFFLGALVGFRNCYVMAKKIYEPDRKKTEDSE